MRVQAYTLVALFLLATLGDGLHASEPSSSIMITSLSQGDWVEGEVEILIDRDVENLELLVDGAVVASAKSDEPLIWDTTDDTVITPALFQVVVRGELENGTQVESSPISVTVLYPRQLTDNPAMDIQPEWHSDGESLVFKSNRGEKDHIFKIYTLIPGEEPQLVQTDRTYHGYPGWSPDGSHMVFNSYDPDIESTSEMDIFVVNLSSGESIPVTSGSDFDDSGRWSPDGNWISFHSTRSGNKDVWKIPVTSDGIVQGDPIRMTFGSGDEECARWSQDGDWLAFEYTHHGGLDYGDGFGNIGMISVEGGEVISLTDDNFNNGYPNWSPDGQLIVYNSKRFGEKSLASMLLLISRAMIISFKGYDLVFILCFIDEPERISLLTLLLSAGKIDNSIGLV